MYVYTVNIHNYAINNAKLILYDTYFSDSLELRKQYTANAMCVPSPHSNYIMNAMPAYCTWWHCTVYNMS